MNGTNTMGKVYMIHFEQPYKHARHYVGYSDNLTFRLQHHRNGTGARLMQVVNEAGIGWVVALVAEGTRLDERALKNRKNTPKLCPVCTGKTAHVCYDCGKVYKFAGWLRRHYLTKHASPIGI
jgi:predicted GIY-YIG superfamily endonuclease